MIKAIFSKDILFRIIAIAVLFTGLFLALNLYLPAGIDWHDTYRPASRALLSGNSPYTIDGVTPFLVAPWGVIPLLPLAMLPEQAGRAALFIVSLAAFAFTAHRIGGRLIAVIAFLLSPTIMHCLLNGNIDWLPLLGFILPPQIGLFFVTIKPQLGSIVILFWFIEAFRTGGIRRVVKVFWPISLVTMLSFIVFGFWPSRFIGAITFGSGFNASLFPISIPVGLALTVAAIRKRKINYAMGASPCLSPYVLFHSWSGALLAILPATAETLAAVVGLWILVIIRLTSRSLFLF
jgi:hypothetical protein